MNKIVNLSIKKDSVIKSSDIYKSLKKKVKSLPTHFLYDKKGSKLFEKICKTKEYYLTRTEKKLLIKHSADIIKTVNPTEILELGGGSSKKTKILIEAKLKVSENLSYSSLDISDEALLMTFKQLEKYKKKLKINLYKGHFIEDLIKLKFKKESRMFLFLGSTLGNFNNKVASKFLKNISAAMTKKDSFLLGVDLLKSKEIILSAYNDKLGFTSLFNKNILDVVNKEFSSNFKEINFKHIAIFNDKKSQIEMYLKAKRKNKIKFPGRKEVLFKEGDKILTEISRKFSDSVLNRLLIDAGLQVKKEYRDKSLSYALLLLKTL